MLCTTDCTTYFKRYTGQQIFFNHQMTYISLHTFHLHHIDSGLYMTGYSESKPNLLSPYIFIYKYNQFKEGSQKTFGPRKYRFKPILSIKLTVPIFLHQMRISTIHVSSVMLVAKIFEIQSLYKR